MTSYRILLLLLLLLLLYGERSDFVEARKRNNQIHRSLGTFTTNFQFTAALYNLSIEENARGREVYATSNDPVRIGVPLPSTDAIVKFKIVEGDKQHFKAETRNVGDFAFLRIRHRYDGILNRELKDRHEFLVKATCRRKDAANLETTTSVILTITDQNDARPIFEQDHYHAQITDQLPAFSDVVQVEASDADIGLNGQIYYSLLNQSADFMIDPLTGWIRTLRSVNAGTYHLRLLAEDRQSRLFYRQGSDDEEQERFPAAIVLNEAKVTIKVNESKALMPQIVFERKPIRSGSMNDSQLVAIIRVSDVQESDEVMVALLNSDYSHAFRIDKEVIGGAWRLDTISGYRLPTNLTLSLIAKVIGSPQRNCTAEIEVEFDEKRSVRFSNVDGTLHLNVNESVPIGFVLITVQAYVTNGFVEDSRRLRYSIIQNDTVSLPFVINEKSGRLRVVNWLDYEQNKSYSFIVSAELPEYKAGAYVQVEVSVVDSNDHSPVFAAKWSRGEPIAISKDFPLEETIVRVDALDSDAGHNGEVHYMLVNDEETPFRVDHKTGDVKLRRAPHVNESSWRLRIRAIDGGWPYPRSSQMILTIFLNHTKIPTKTRFGLSRDPPNFNPPKFEILSQSLRISEDAPIGHLLTTLNASDSDRGYAGILQFACWDELFEVNVHSGELRVAGRLHELMHREISNNDSTNEMSIQHRLNIMVCDMGDPVKCTNATLNVTVVDSNNNAPLFDKPFYRIHVAEDTEVGSELLIVTATDDDFGQNGLVSYKMAGDENQVEIDARKGIIRLLKQFDRETSEMHRFSVVAYDHGHPPKLTFVNVSVIVEDVNDNAPRCAEQIQKVQIPEDYPNGALVTCIAAFDADIGENARITYGFDTIFDKSSSQLPFRIQPDTGCIFIDSMVPLDFETRPLYNITVEAMDNGQPTFSTVCRLVVELIDVNENAHPPIFSDIAHEASVYENQPIGTEVLALQATDPDDSVSPIKYSIVDGDGIGYFTIDPTGIIRTAVPLDREVENRYWLTIQAEDSASVPLYSIVHVFVRVLDKNDHLPLPSKPIYFAEVLENSPEDTVAVKVEAVDKDDLPSTSGEGSKLQFRIASGDPQSFFSIDPKTGYMTTRGRRRLDRETQREHQVQIEICDQGTPPLCATVPVIVTVRDVNDNPPVFRQQIYNFNIPAQKTGKLCRVFAVDADEGINAQLFYNITSNDSRFSIDETGMIRISEAMKADEIAPLTIQATDMGEPHHSASARIILTAVGRKPSQKNANRKPRLLNAQHWSRLPISDADNVGETIGLIEAEDPDGDQLWWTITAGNLNSTFAIRCDAGELVLARPLEYVDFNLTEFHLEFSVSDGIDEATGKIIVEVSRSPQRRPHFSSSHYQTRISEKTPVGTVIYTVKATVDESGLTRKNANKMIVYSIHSVENLAAIDKFRIDPNSGNVVVMEALGNEVARDFSIIIAARSGQLSNYATLSVTLLDENDHPPKFLQSEYSVKILASSPIGTVAVHVQAHDPDNGQNGVIRYAIAAGNDYGYFTINRVSGEVSTVKALSALEHSEALLIVRATDQAEYSRSDTCSVRIQTTIDEQWQPIFQKSVYSQTVRESTAPGTLLMTVYAEGVSGIRYSLDQQHSAKCHALAIHQVSGAVFLKKRLNRERHGAVMNCRVIATNTIGTASSALIVLKLVDVNEHAPFFNQTVYYGYVQENMPPGSAVLLENETPLIVKAFDQDNGPNGLVNYRIVSPIEPFFTVDFVSGALRTKASIDYEKVKEWSVHVLAADMAAVPLTSAVPALVRIAIRDVNDEPPQFIKESFNAILTLPTVNGVVVAKVPAYDADTVGRLRFAIKSNEARSLFRIDEFEGVVRVNMNRSTDFTKKQYNIPLVVSDGVHSDSASLIVTIRNATTNADSFHFLQSEYRVSLRENQSSAIPQPLLTVTAVDPSVDEAVMYRILNPRAEFVIGAGSGVISWTGVMLDREMTPTIKLVVQGRTSSGNSASVQCLVVIDVEDVNDCAPRFLGVPYLASVPRDAKPNEKAFSVRAVDADEGMNGAVRYSLTDDALSHFKINKFDGRITVTKSLDSLQATSISLIVSAIDQGNPPLSTNTTVSIELVDRAMPIFTHRIYRCHINENAPIGSTLHTVKAISNMNKQIGYILKSGDPSKRFRVDFNSGAVSVHRPLDREQCATYNLTVMAIDVTRNGVHSECTVVVTIDDINDNPPRFEMPFYEVHVSEAAHIGTQILKVTAHDPDSTVTTVSYGLNGANSSMLSIDSVTGEITLMKQLDFETQKSYVFTLTAADAEQLASHATLQLFVDDVNDMAPTFSTPVIRTKISDDALPDQFIVKLNAVDMDTVTSVADGHRFVYSVIDGDETLIDLDRHSGVILLARTIADEDIRMHQKHLNISVSDGVFTAYSQLIIEIVASTSRRALPRFEQAQYSASVSENGKIGAPIIRIRAREGIPPLKYSFGGNNDLRTWPVAIDKESGKVTSRISLDYEKQSVYRIPLVVTDAGGRRAFSTLILNILDENDCAPKFISSVYETSVLADTEDGQALFMVFAVDEDVGDQVEYTVVPDGDTRSSYIRVHPRQGIVSLRKSVRNIVGERIRVFIRATDLANPPHQNETEVVINVQSANISLPHFSNHHYLFTIPEDASIGTVVGRLQQNQQQILSSVRFSIASHSGSSEIPFSVDQSSGRLIVNSPLDREKVAEWRFIVRLSSALNNIVGEDSDMAVGTLAMVTIRLSDVNDNAPQFHGIYERIAISEDSPIGTSVAVMSATDADSGPNSRIFFSIEQDSEPKAFKIDRESGWLMIAAMLDREAKDEHHIRVIASDEGRLNNTRNITIIVGDANDSPPVFDRSEYFVDVSFDQLYPGQQLIHIFVTDADLPPYNTTLLYIVDGDEYGLFRLDNNGRLYIEKVPHARTETEYLLTILAFDGKHDRKAHVKVKLRVDSAVVNCSEEQLEISVKEDVKEGTVLLGRREEKLISSVHFTLISDVEIDNFAVTKTGDLILTKELDRELCDTYEFVLNAENGDQLCSQRVIVRVEDVNDEFPKFDKAQYSATVKENCNATDEERVFLLRLYAEDQDLGEAGRVRYKFDDQINKTYRNIFRIDANTGVLTLIEPLDREVQDRYEFNVRAIDGGGNSAKSKVLIEVADENDNAPLFESSVYRLKVVEDEAVGYELIKVNAIGGDRDESVQYQLDAPDGLDKYFMLDSETGSLKLAQPLDYELVQHLTVSIIATDSGSPPLSSRCSVEIEILDVNDNAPHFTQSIYKATIPENSTVGTKVVQVIANDSDSEHFGRVLYSLTDDTQSFVIDDDGWIIVDTKLDREIKSAYRLGVHASDGGSPSLNASSSVIIEIEDVNDNVPIFAQCNMTAVVQESATRGYVLLTVSLTDADTEPNAGPYELEIIGDGASSFAFDSNMNLITKSLLSHSKKDVYLLTVKATDRGGLSSECPLTIYVKEESRHPPVIEPLMITLNTLMGEFLGGKIGRVHARDDDKADMLRYSIVNTPNSASLPNGRTAALYGGFSRRLGPQQLQFSVDSDSGEIYAEPDLLAGIHRFNVTVTDGKFTSRALVTVDVSPIDQDALDHSVSVRVRNLTGEHFLADYSRKFYRSFARYLNVKPTNIRILSLQDVNGTTGNLLDTHTQRHHRLRIRRRLIHVRRSLHKQEPSDRDIDILFTVSRGDSRGYYRPNYIRQRLEQNIVELADDTGLQIVSMTTEVCRRDVCVRGECRDRLYLDDALSTYYYINDQAFYAPRHVRTFECICREGFAGKRCDVPVDKCSKEQCTKDEMCVPMDTDIGFECVCPPGTTGDRCMVPTCGKDNRECSQDAEISVNGDAFFQITIANSLERRLELSFRFRTISSDATVMYATGNSDFHAIEISRGYAQYRWDCGSGVGVVQVNSIRVSDGKWHSVKVSRRSRHVKLTVDDAHTVDGHSPAGSDVINLYKNAMRLTFGAQVNYIANSGGSTLSANDLRPLISKGMIGCFGRISVDGFDLPKTKQGLRLYNTRLDCDAVGNEPCSVNPCSNDGTCIPTGDTSFSCVCPPRYAGQMCEIDLTPCVSRPCPPGVQCTNLHNDFYCSCPPGFTGKTCQLRGDWDPCSPNPCGPFGKCIRLPQSNGFICNCSHGYSGTSCSDRPPTLVADSWPLGFVEVALAISILLIVILAVLICCYLRNKKYRYDKPAEQKDPEYEVHNFNARVSKSFDGAPACAAPPPLPPRAFRSMHNNQLSNFEQAQLTGLPTVQVRPLPISERLGGSSLGGGSRSPSIAESGRWKSRRATTPISQKNIDVTRTGLPSSNDETDQVSRTDILRRYGRTIADTNDDEIDDNSPSRVRYFADNRQRASKTRVKRGHADGSPSLKKDAAVSNVVRNNWRQECDRRIDGACGIAADKRSERMKLHLLGNNRIKVGDTILSPREEDDEYMTMRPVSRRLPSDSAESQRRPLLEMSDSDGMDGTDLVYPDEVDPSERAKPRPPPHSNHRKHAESALSRNRMDTSRVYDDPASEQNNIVNTAASNEESPKLSTSSGMQLSSTNISENFDNIDDESDSDDNRNNDDSDDDGDANPISESDSRYLSPATTPQKMAVL